MCHDLTAAAPPPTLPPVLSVLSGLMALLFLFAAAVQYNDPDPIQWMAIYGAAAIVSAWAAFRRAGLPAAAPGLVGLAAFVWACTIAPRALGKVSPLAMFKSWEMKNAVIEENREMFGLLIVAAWMLVLFIARRGAPSR